MITRKLTTDVLVVGSGLSGIKVSKELAERQKHVLMVTKTKLASGSSFYPLKASLGTQVTKDEADRDIFLKDIDDLSRGMHEEELAEIYVEEIPERVKEYEEIGIDAQKLSGERKACFANHARDIYLLRDWEKIRKNARNILESYEHFELMEKTICCTLIKKDDKIAGAVLIGPDQEFIFVECKAVVLATGGFGNIFKHNLNPADVDGSGHILALDAGAELVNMEFIQFIPGITSPRYKTLFGEQTLAYCTDIVDDEGNSILDPFLPEDVSKEECLSIRSGHGPFTHTFESKYFDIAMMKRIIETKNENGFTLKFDEKLYENEEEFYTVYLDWLKGKNVHLVEDEVRIAPFGHASNGGVHIDGYGRTGVDGLYAIGELASTVEGANRLGGNSTGACMVFGKRVALDCERYLEAGETADVSMEEAESYLTDVLKSKQKQEVQQESPYTVNDIIEKIRELMWYHGNVVRSEENLTKAIAEIKQLEESFQPYTLMMQEKHARKSVIKASNYIVLSQVLLQAMLERKESRGAHYREDYPEEREEYNKRLFICQDAAQKMQFYFKQ